MTRDAAKSPAEDNSEPNTGIDTQGATMSNDQTTEQTEAPAETLEEQTEDTSTPEKDTSQDTGTREDRPARDAAKYRHKLRDAEAERDALAEQVHTMQTAMIDAEVTKAGYKPAAFWTRDDNTVEAFFDGGTLNTEALADAIKTTADELGLKGKALGPIAPKEGGRPTNYRPTKSWDSAFKASSS